MTLASELPAAPLSSLTCPSSSRFFPVLWDQNLSTYYVFLAFLLSVSYPLIVECLGV